MPARTELFDAENRRHSNALHGRFLAAVGGAALMFVGVLIDSSEIIIGGGAVAVAAGIHASADSNVHGHMIDRLNRQSNQPQGEL
ncbi:MAG: hypothetical protein ABI354_00795 [Candidatus Saccharimonadales bacterium]